MESIGRRLERLESRLPPPPRGRLGHVTGAEIRRLEAQIRRQERGQDEVGPAPEADVAERLEPAAEVAAVLRELDRLERIDQATEGPRWGK
jgi:phosphate uptake regulator